MIKKDIPGSRVQICDRLQEESQTGLRMSLWLMWLIVYKKFKENGLLELIQ